jgi:hypothetical protein
MRSDVKKLMNKQTILTFGVPSYVHSIDDYFVTIFASSGKNTAKINLNLTIIGACYPPL